MTAQVQFLPYGPWSAKDLDTLIIALETRVKAREVMHVSEAAEFLGVSERKMYTVPKSVFPYHTVPGFKGRIYLRSELVSAIKKH